MCSPLLSKWATDVLLHLQSLVFAPVGITPGDVLINDGGDHKYDINKRTAFEK